MLFKKYGCDRWSVCSSNNALQCYNKYYLKMFEISMFRATKKIIKTLQILKLTVRAWELSK